jgi:threonine synthase
MLHSYLTHLQCSKCQTIYDADSPQGTCSCGAPLLARYNLEELARAVPAPHFAGRPSTLWRYSELLPVRAEDSVVSLGERVTPVVPLPRLGDLLHLTRLSIKDEGVLPTGTFKARGAAVGISRARELGITRVAMPTNGNAGAAWAAYGARAGVECLIVMPKDAPPVPRAECFATGARLFLVNGLIGDAGSLVAGAIAEQAYFDTSTLKEPYRLEGKKTMGLELFEQLGWRVPDAILYPAGGGVGLIGIHKALIECQRLGWLGPKCPRLVAVQSAGCAPVVKAWEADSSTIEAWPAPSTIAFGINVANPLGGALMLRAIRDTSGCAIAVTDEEVLFAGGLLARTEGLFICPEGAACVAAAQRLRESDWLKQDEEVVIFNTGTGLLYSHTVVDASITLDRTSKIPARLVAIEAATA